MLLIIIQDSKFPPTATLIFRINRGQLNSSRDAAVIIDFLDYNKTELKYVRLKSGLGKGNLIWHQISREFQCLEYHIPWMKATKPSGS